MYRYYSNGELVGTATRELDLPGASAANGGARQFVFEPGPAFARVWPVVEAVQRAGMALIPVVQGIDRELRDRAHEHDPERMARFSPR